MFVTAILPSGREHRFFVRTGDHVGGYWTQVPPPGQPMPPPWEFRAIGYQMHIWLAKDQADLPEVVGDDARLPCRRYWRITLPGERPHEEDPSCLATISTWYVGFPDRRSESRIGRFPAETIYELFTDDAELEGLFGPEGLSRMALRERLDTGDLSRPPDGRFDETVPSLRFEQDLIIYRDTTIQLTAVRISTDAVVVANRRQ